MALSYQKDGAWVETAKQSDVSALQSVVAPLLPVDKQNTVGSSPDRDGLPNVWFRGQRDGAIGANQWHGWPFYVSEEITLSDWKTRIVTNGNAAAQEMRCAIYTKTTALGGALVAELPLLTVPAGNTGVFVTALAAPLVLPVGAYWIANLSNATFTLRRPRASVPFVRMSQTNIAVARFEAGVTYGAMPSTVPAIALPTDTDSWGPPSLLVWS
jgi:hypothetical protein